MKGLNFLPTPFRCSPLQGMHERLPRVMRAQDRLISQDGGRISGKGCAGLHPGFEDERGLLFREIVRILREKRPKHFLLENVPGLKHMSETYNLILDELAARATR